MCTCVHAPRFNCLGILYSPLLSSSHLVAFEGQTCPGSKLSGQHAPSGLGTHAKPSEALSAPKQQQQQQHRIHRPRMTCFHFPDWLWSLQHLPLLFPSPPPQLTPHTIATRNLEIAPATNGSSSGMPASRSHRPFYMTSVLVFAARLFTVMGGWLMR